MVLKRSEGDVIITYNGEIYNYHELRMQLEKRGVDFLTNSDTELLLHLYRTYGSSLVHQLRGMYAFAIWDEVYRLLLLARDPFGIKPLYIADDGRTLRFASQVKALLQGEGIDRRPEPAGHIGFFLFGHVPEPYTLFQGIRAFAPGLVTCIHDGGKQERTVTLDICAEISKAAPDTFIPAERVDTLVHTVRDSVRAHLTADVPIGLFLSSGQDSSIIAKAAVDSGCSLRTVTVSFDRFAGTPNDEAAGANLIASYLGSTHTTAKITRREFLDDYEHIISSMDQPTIDGINTYYAAKSMARAGVKVALSGLGADELFNGYYLLESIYRIRRVSSLRRFKILARTLQCLGQLVACLSGNVKYRSVMSVDGDLTSFYLLKRAVHMPVDLPDRLDSIFIREGLERLQVGARHRMISSTFYNDHAAMVALELCGYVRDRLLRDTDWASMAHGVEVRVPYLDSVLLKAIAPMIVSNQAPSKTDLLAAFPDALPREMKTRSKVGFIAPVKDWLSPEAITDDRALARHIYGFFSSCT
jgi:asparagine synthase (glutamine-hydrolysing)